MAMVLKSGSVSKIASKKTALKQVSTCMLSYKAHPQTGSVSTQPESQP